MNGLQLDMPLADRQNEFKTALDNGKFIFLAECNAPVSESRCAAAAERILPLANCMAEQKDLCGGIALSDMRDAPWSALEIAAALPENLRRTALCFLSGENKTPAMINSQLEIAMSSGAVNIVPVSGNGAPFPVRECRNRPYCSSVRQLKMLRGKPLFAGTVFNPFHSDAHTMLASYDALENKIAAGAQFIIAQSGWDMLQNQTLAWYLLRRKQFLPLLARITLLTPDRVEKIISGEIPGVRMPSSFRKLIARELMGSKAQFEAAQYRRLELQVAGYRHLGYSGVIVSGVDVPGRATLVASRIRSALQEFRSFDHFLSEYREHQATAEMNYNLQAYHMFDRVLRRPYPFDEVPEISDPGEVDFSLPERIGWRIRKFLFAKSDKMRPARDILLKKLLVNCRSCEKCTLPEYHYYCPENCPKRLDSGPCGGVKEDGKCEISGNECIFVRIMRCKRYLRTHSGLESGV